MAKCDFCNERARFDTRTLRGHWANVCDSHFVRMSAAPQWVIREVDHHNPDAQDIPQRMVGTYSILPEVL